MKILNKQLEGGSTRHGTQTTFPNQQHDSAFDKPCLGKNLSKLAAEVHHKDAAATEVQGKKKNRTMVRFISDGNSTKMRHCQKNNTICRIPVLSESLETEFMNPFV